MARLGQARDDLRQRRAEPRRLQAAFDAAHDPVAEGDLRIVPLLAAAPRRREQQMERFVPRDAARLGPVGAGAEEVSGIALASYFARAPSRGRRRSDLEPDLVFSRPVRDRLGGGAEQAIGLAGDPATWRACERVRPTVPIATREWLAEAALALGRAEGPAVMWALLRAMSELENVAQRLIGSRSSRATVREVLHGVGHRTLRAEPFAALLVRVLKISQALYAAFRHAGFAHDSAWAQVEDRLWSPHPTGRGDERGAYLPSLVQAASGNARKRLRRNVEGGRTVQHAATLLARFTSGQGSALWPWRDGAGK